MDTEKQFKKRNNNTKNKSFGQQAWKTQRPLPDETITKTEKGENWHYCSHHKAWGRYKSKESFKGIEVQIESFSSTHNNLHVSMANIGISDVQLDTNNKWHQSICRFHCDHKTWGFTTSSQNIFVGGKQN
jgi:hypothetical protein